MQENSISRVDQRQDGVGSMVPDTEDWLRSRVYGLLARLFADIPSQDVIDSLAAVDVGDDTSPLAVAWRDLAAAAEASDPESLDIEFHALFIGLGRGEVMPYGSWYQTGFLMGRPLVKLATICVSSGSSGKQTCASRKIMWERSLNQWRCSVDPKAFTSLASGHFSVTIWPPGLSALCRTFSRRNLLIFTVPWALLLSASWLLKNSIWRWSEDRREWRKKP